MSLVAPRSKVGGKKRTGKLLAWIAKKKAVAAVRGREAWSREVQAIMEHYENAHTAECGTPFDYSLIRPKGEALSNTGRTQCSTTPKMA